MRRIAFVLAASMVASAAAGTVVPSAPGSKARSVEAAASRPAPPLPGAPPRDGEPSACIAGPTLAIDPAGLALQVGTQSYSRTLRLCDRDVVLTFDDGPSPRTTPMVLKALKDAGVHALFFLVGRQACAFPALAREEMVEGHTVGHHSDTHPSFTLRGFTEAAARRDIDDGIEADEKAIYGPEARDAAHPHVPFFRFPGFADTKALLADLDIRGIAVFGSDLWAGDWIATSPDRERARILELLERRPHHNGIILFHDTKMSTARMLPDLLRDLKARHYRVVQVVYRPHAPPPALVDGPPGVPETVRIIDHLPTPIVPGRHGAPAGAGASCDGATPARQSAVRAGHRPARTARLQFRSRRGRLRGAR